MEFRIVELGSCLLEEGASFGTMAGALAGIYDIDGVHDASFEGYVLKCTLPLWHWAISHGSDE
jgi:hypothetical protein